ncbi:unnamed protein product [Penicillium olsonii]|nr:unnamed protein product [Penicillium olsonii]
MLLVLCSPSSCVSLVPALSCTSFIQINLFYTRLETKYSTNVKLDNLHELRLSNLVVKDLNIRHPTQTATTGLLILSFLKASGALITNMLPQQGEHFGILPTRRNGTVSGSKGANCLRPFATLGAGLLPSLGDGVLLGSGSREVLWGVLSRPVVDVPVVLIEEAIVLNELVIVHLTQVDICEGGKKQV